MAPPPAPPPEGAGFLVYCNFGSENRAAVEVQRAVRARIAAARTAPLRQSEVSADAPAEDAAELPPYYLLLPRGSVAHMGLAWLQCDGALLAPGPADDGTPRPGATCASDPVSLFAAMVGKPPPTHPSSDTATAEDAPTPLPAPTPAILKACQQLFPVSRCCEATEQALQATVFAEATMLMGAREGSLLGAAAVRLAVAVHTRGDDSRAATANGAATLTKAAAIEATLRGLTEAREAASLPPFVADLHAPDIVVVINQWRQTLPSTAGSGGSASQPAIGGGGDDGPGQKVTAAAARFTDPNSPNQPTCGVTMLPRALCDVRSKGILPVKPLGKAPPGSTPAGGDTREKASAKSERKAIEGGGSGSGDGGVGGRGSDGVGVSSGGGSNGGGGGESVSTGGGGAGTRESGGGGGALSSAEWKGGHRGQVAKTAKTSGDDTPGHTASNTNAGTASRSPMPADEALGLLDAALAKRVASGLLVASTAAVVATTPMLAAAVAACVIEESARGTAVRLVHGTGDGFDGLTVELIGAAVLLEQHRQWAAYEPLLAALQMRLGDRVSVFLKQRWSRDPSARGGVRVSGDALPSPPPPLPPPSSSPHVSTVAAATAAAAAATATAAATSEGRNTHGDHVVVREPGVHGLRFGLWLTGEEHIGVFSDSRPTRELIRSLSKDKRVLNLFSYTGGFGVAASAGGARCSHNVDSKAPCLAAAKVNYALNALDVDPDGRSFQKADVVRFLNRTAKSTGTRYDLIVVDPPPRFSRNSDWAYEAELHTGQLLAMCVGVAAAKGATLVAGINALTVSDSRFEEMIAEAAQLSGRSLTARRWIGAGEDFPRCPYRPTARFVELAVGDETETTGVGTSLAEELGMRDEGGDDDEEGDEGGDDDDAGLDDGDGDGDDDSKGDGSGRSGRNTEHGATTNGKRGRSASEHSTQASALDSAPATAPTTAIPPTAASTPAPASPLECQLCTGTFASRNKLFKHLKCAKNACGAWCDAQGGIMAAAVLMECSGAVVPRFAPPPLEKRSNKLPKKQRVRPPAEAVTPRVAKPALDNELWVGGFPAAFATCKALKLLLWNTLPGSAGIAQPVVGLRVD